MESATTPQKFDSLATAFRVTALKAIVDYVRRNGLQLNDVELDLICKVHYPVVSRARCK